MATRLQLQHELETILGSRNVYFQPPENFKIKYPCFVYHMVPGDTRYANNLMYMHTARYTIKYITQEAETLDFVRTVLRSFNLCSHSQSYTSDGLYHEVFDLYY